MRAAGSLVDLEARVTDEHHQALKVWLRLLACTNRIEAQIRARLRAEFGITLARFDLMAQLERSVNGLKMSELSKRLMVSGGNVTGLTDELEKEELVAREDDPSDRVAPESATTKTRSPSSGESGSTASVAPSNAMTPPATEADWSMVPQGVPARCSASWASRTTSVGESKRSARASASATQRAAEELTPKPIGTSPAMASDAGRW